LEVYYSIRVYKVSRLHPILIQFKKFKALELKQLLLQ
jgi:hypothetical protein